MYIISNIGESKVLNSQSPAHRHC